MDTIAALRANAVDAPLFCPNCTGVKAVILPPDVAPNMLWCRFERIRRDAIMRTRRFAIRDAESCGVRCSQAQPTIRYRSAERRETPIVFTENRRSSSSAPPRTRLLPRLYYRRPLARVRFPSIRPSMHLSRSTSDTINTRYTRFNRDEIRGRWVGNYFPNTDAVRREPIATECNPAAAARARVATQLQPDPHDAEADCVGSFPKICEGGCGWCGPVTRSRGQRIRRRQPVVQNDRPQRMRCRVRRAPWESREGKCVTRGGVWTPWPVARARPGRQDHAN